MASTPSRIGQFEVLRQIGSGGMGAVYLGRDAELDRQVAIKVIREEVHDQEVLDRFFREARASAALRHPNIITIYASGQHEHQPYMVMEFVDGESLADIIKKRRALTIAEKIAYLEQICAGLHFAHRAGIVHRDIKPANVMVDRDGVVRILDFGIARIEGSAMTQDGALMGSLNYMSPEQMLGRPVDLRSDMFSVGSLAYELISFQQAFKGSLNDGLLQRLPHEDPPPLHHMVPGLPAALEQVIMRALEKAPDSRFKDLSEMRTALLNVSLTDAVEEDQHTVFIPRPGASPDSGVVPVAPPSTHSVSPPPAVVTPSVPATAPPAPAPPTAVPQAPASQTWQAKKKPATTSIKPPATATATRPATAVRPPAAAVPRPPAPAPPSSRKWVLAGLVGALLIGGGAAIPFLMPSPPSALERERPGVEAAMERYRVGYQNRSMAAVAAIFPTLPRDSRAAMQREFTNCLVYEVTFQLMQVEMPATDDSTAQVDVNSTHVCTPKSGAAQTTSQQHEVFTLRKKGDSWSIESVARPGAPSAGRPQ